MRKFFFAAALAVAGLFGASGSADAGFQVTFRVSDGVGADAFVTVIDNMAGDDSGTGNRIVVDGLDVTDGTTTYQFNVSLSRTNSPGGLIAFVSNGTNEITGSGAATIEIIVSANGFTSPVGELNAISGSTFQFLSGTVSGNQADHSYSAYYDSSNALASTVPAGLLIGSAVAPTASAPGGNTDLEDQEVFVASGTYALNLGLKVNLLDSGSNVIDLDGTLEVNPVPAPAGVVLALAALPMFGIGTMLRRKKVVA